MSTIVGIATAPGIGGIGIIRMSGEKTFEILDKIFIPKTKQDISEIKGYSIKYGNVVENNKIIDEVINLVNPTSIKDLGKVMKEITPRVKNRCDMSKLNSILREKIN